MEHYINKDALVAKIEKRIKTLNEKLIKHPISSSTIERLIEENKKILSFLNTLEMKEVDLELEIDNNNPKITAGTKIRSKTNPDIVLSIISDDCHEDEFECSNGSVLSLKQIEKYYDLIT